MDPDGSGTIEFNELHQELRKAKVDARPPLGVGVGVGGVVELRKAKAAVRVRVRVRVSRG